MRSLVAQHNLFIPYVYFQGRIDFKNGDQFEGDFDHNEIHGDGELICVNGLIYKGKWEQSKVIEHFEL